MKRLATKNIGIYVLFIILSFCSNGQVLENAEATFHLDGFPYDGGGFAVDNFGNTYTSMLLGANIVFPSGNTVGTGESHLFKHDKNGQLLWSYSVGSGSIRDIQIDELNNIYVSGVNASGLFPDSVNPGSIYNNTCFVAKLSSDGSYDWITRFPTLPNFSIMENGNIAFAIDYNPTQQYDILGNEDLSLLGFNSYDHYVYGELDVNGDVLWRIVDTQDIVTYNLKLVGNCGYNDGKLYFWGNYHDNVLLGNTQIDLDNIPPQSGTTYPMNAYLAVVDMQTQQIVAATSSSFLNFSEIAFDSQDRIYLATSHFASGNITGDGSFQGQLFPEPERPDAYVIRLNPDLSFDASYDICGFSLPTSEPLWLLDIVVKDDNLYGIGATNGCCGTDMYMYPGGTNLAGMNNIFVFRLDGNLDYKYSSIIPFTNAGALNSNTHLLIDANDDVVTIVAETDSPTSPLGNSTNDFFIGTYKTNSNLIKGRAYKDYNQSGTYDAGDVPINGNVVGVSPGSILSVTYPDGRYEIYVDSGEFNIQLPVSPTYYSKQPDSVTFTLNGNSLIDSADLTLIPIPGGNDIKVDFYSIYPVVVGQTAIHKILVTNEGTFPETGTLELTPLNYSLPINAPVTTPAMTQVGLNYIYNYSLQPGDTFSIIVKYDVPMAFLSIINEPSFTTASVQIPVDVNLLNNSASFNQDVLASYDPNIKEVNRPVLMEYNSLPTFEFLSYTIHFQNEGNYQATNILVKDEISDLLNLQSLQVVDYSDEVRTEISGRTIKFYFDSIMLPSISTDTLGSMGYVHFKIKKNTNLVVNDTVANRGFIFFDENPAIITNFTYNIVVQGSAVNDTLFVPFVACDSAFVNGDWYYSSQSVVTDVLYWMTATGGDSVIVTDITFTTNDISTTYLAGTISSNQAIGTYQWLDCNNSSAIIQGEINQDYSPTANGSYAVTVIQNGCTDTSECVLVDNLSLESPTFANTIAVFPNPTSSKVTIQFTDFQASIRTELTGISGRSIGTSNFESVQKIDLDIDEAPGFYFLHIYNQKGEKATIKLMKR